MPAGYYNITAEQGATFNRVLTWRDAASALINLTGYTARMQVRADYSSTTAILSLTTENSRITLGGALGTITLLVAASDMAALSSGSFVYDLELVNVSTVTRLVQGTFVVNVEVTR
jgi:tRNA threonylcarbamoyladenosine modification (KEOPS) complex  Pcc1 subunit